VIGFLDCATGISGDKFLAACIDAGASLDAVNAAVAAVAPEAVVRTERVLRSGIAALSVTVDSTAEEPRSRTWSSIRETIEAAGLAHAVRDRSLAAFTLLAEAEARVHGTDPAHVHFHEVGAVDSIADVVGVAAALADLGLARLVCGPVAVGSGTVTTAHGVLPVPAPATALLLEGVPVYAGPAPGEATTPTGAALVRAHATGFGPLPAMVLAATGHGAGTRETPPVANVARLLLGRETAADTSADPDAAGTASPAPGDSPLTEEAVVEIATTVDHLSAEQLAFCVEELLASGALDVWHTPALMKKGRAGARCVGAMHAQPTRRVSLAW
jgi:pyridinium-3,5-bisthiocarboxylic acid mononucleotide nickel chelatase